MSPSWTYPIRDSHNDWISFWGADQTGTADQHLPLGAVPRSSTDWPKHIKRLKATGYDGTITLEVFAPHKEYLLVSRDLLRKWWSEA